MKYVGSKNRHAKELLPIILKNRTENQWYVEPFVGGFNMIDKVDGNRIGSDVDFYLIELFKAIQQGWIPPDNISFEEYTDIRINKNSYPHYMVGFVGFGCSYSGKFFGGYARDGGGVRNYCLETKKNLLIQAPKINDVYIYNESYDRLVIPDNSIVYCDPPYRNTTKYKHKFDHDKFWEWCRNSKNEIFISEYSAPDDFECIFEKMVNSSLTQNTGSKCGIEKLFIKKI